MGGVLGHREEVPKDFARGSWEVKQVERRTEVEKRGLKDVGIMVLKMDGGARARGQP